MFPTTHSGEEGFSMARCPGGILVEAPGTTGDGRNWGASFQRDGGGLDSARRLAQALDETTVRRSSAAPPRP